MVMQKHTSSLEDELIAKAMYPKREEFQWRPAPILCKRFDLIDPYMGKVFHLYVIVPVFRLPDITLDDFYTTDILLSWPAMAFKDY